MASGNLNGHSARVLDVEVFDVLRNGILRYAKECRNSFFYPNKIISDVNDYLNDAKYTIEAELGKARDKRIDAYYTLEVAKARRIYDQEGHSYTPDYSAEETAYQAALCEEKMVKQKLSELKELRNQYYRVEAEYKNNQEVFEKFIDTDLEDAAKWMKEEYDLIKDYIRQSQQLKL